MNKTFISELKFSFKIVRIIISIIIFVILFLSFIFPEVLLNISPVCVSRLLYGRECFMCGMTRAFVEISSGRFSEAFELNKFSVFIFIMFTINSILFFAFIIKAIIVRFGKTHE
ncbi:MAG: DUF2752 domain-containing protein [Bacteroidetes bacterium]|nr:DUF2752 domain-containing protein [Bacteroidota bacterium]